MRVVKHSVLLNIVLERTAIAGMLSQLYITDTKEQNKPPNAGTPNSMPCTNAKIDRNAV